MANKKGTRTASGAGSLRKVTKTVGRKAYTFWEARITVGTDPGTGKQLVRSFSGKTQKEVREKMQAAAATVNAGDYFEPSKMTVAEWLDIWLKEYGADWKYKTREKYETVCRIHLKPAVGAVKLSKLTPPQIQSFYNELGRTGKVTRKKDKNGKIVERREPLAAKSIRLVHGVLSKALNTAVRVGYIKRNAAELCTTPRPERKEIKPLTDAQVKDFVSLCAGEDYGRIYKLILFTGLREGEALGLTWDCVDFKSGTLTVKQQLQRQGDKDEIVPLKNSKPRYLTAPAFVMELLRDEHTHQLEQRLSAGELWQGWQSQEEMKTALVFLRDDGSNITAAALYQRYKHLAEMIGAPESRVHDLRHTFAVLSLQNGDNVKTVQDNLGHATAAFTLDVYGHVSEKMKEDSAARMQAYIDAMA
jgi:integrase